MDGLEPSKTEEIKPELKEEEEASEKEEIKPELKEDLEKSRASEKEEIKPEEEEPKQNVTGHQQLMAAVKERGTIAGNDKNESSEESFHDAGEKTYYRQPELGECEILKLPEKEEVIKTSPR